MKILVVSSPLAGHLSPLLPVIGALVDAGDEVVVVSGPAAEPLVQRTGATHQRAGNDSDVWFARLKERTRGEPGDGIAPERINHYFVPRLFAEIATADMIDDVVRAGRQLAPDLVLFESLAFAGPLVADLLDVPGVHHLFGPVLPHEILAKLRDKMPALQEALVGHFGDHHARLVSMMLGHIDTLQGDIDTLTEVIDEQIRPFSPHPATAVHHPGGERADR